MSVDTNVVLGTESGEILGTQSGAQILVEAQSYSLPAGPPDVRITVLSPSANTVIALDASGDLSGPSWQVQYEKTPGGCGAGSVVFGLRYEEAYERGYLTAMNLFEISTGDDVLQKNIASGATKLYVISTEPYDPSQGEPVQQIYLWDGYTLTMRIPVTGIGEDSGGPYITVGSPLAGGGNPTTIPAYTAGVTIVGRRRYAGYVALRERPKQNEPQTTVSLQALACIFDLTMGSYSIQTSANLDIGAAVYNTLATFGVPGGAGGFSTTITGSCGVGATVITVASAVGISAGSYIELDYGNPNGERVLVASIAGTTCTLENPTLYAHSSSATAQSQSRWPQFYLNQANFPTLGLTFTGSRTTSPVTTMLSDFIGAISTGDVWSLVIDHDRQPKLQQLFTLASDSYAYPVTLFQGGIDFEPTTINVTDENTTNLANAIMVTGATNPATQIPYSAVVVDDNSISLYDGLQFDGTPVSNTALTTDDSCAAYGAGVLAGQSLAQQQTTLRVFGLFVVPPTFEPQGLPAGDAVRGINGVTVVGFDQIGVSNNNCPDSEMISTITTVGSLLTWALESILFQIGWLTFGLVVVDLVGPAGSNAFELTASGTGMANSPGVWVGPGRPFILSIYIDASGVSAGTVTASIMINAGTTLATVTQTNGVAGVVTTAPVTLPAGANFVYVQIVANGVTCSNPVVFSQPMLADGGVARSYVPNYAAPAIYGLASSVVTTITATGDRYQDVTFSPIEPDWNSAVAEQLNALASQQRQNQSPGTSIGQYTVSPSFFPLGISPTSLTVTVPSALAIFALGTTPVVVGGNSFTLPASAVSWVWLNPNNTYTINQDQATVSGAILIGFFQTGTSGVNGFTQKASVGLVTLSQAQLPSMGSEATAAPILTPSSPTITYPVYGNGTYDAAATFSVDIYGAAWQVGLALFAVAAGYGGDPRDFPYGSIPVVEWSGASVNAVWTGIGAGNSKDLYVAYQDGQGRLSLATKVGTTNANQAGASALLGVPTTAPNPTASPTAFTYAANGGGTYDAECTIYLDTNGTYNDNGLAEIECVMAPHASALTSTSAGWTPSGNPQLVNGTGTYVCAWGGCGIQVQYDVGIRYVGQNGSRSYVYIVGTTTASQLAQLEFPTASVDPTTGYIVISNQNIYPTGLQYELPAAGIGSMLSASWSQKIGSTSVDPTIWLFYSSSGGGNGYIADWFGSYVEIYKCTAGTFTLLATSTATVAKDTTNFHNLEFIASETTSGTINLTATLDGVLMCQATDSSSPYTSGFICAQMRDASATNYIDQKTIEIELGGSPSSSEIKAQGSIPPAGLPLVEVYVNPGSTNTYSVLGGQFSFADGSTLVPAIVTGQPVPGGGSGSAGTWYACVGYVIATGAWLFYLSTTSCPVATQATFIADGVIPLGINYSVTATSGTVSIAFGGTVSRRYLA